MENSFISATLEACDAQASRLATLGGWPSWVDAKASLTSRVPTGSDTAPGFDAGLACVLGLIPEEKQRLAATLHAAYTEGAVFQIRAEAAAGLEADSETTWWLAACSICREGGIDVPAFLDQIAAFKRLAADPAARQAAAIAELAAMKQKFVLVDGLPFVIQDGGLQGAYVAGFDWGVQYVAAYGIFFLGTFRPTLGLEDFKFSSAVDGKGRSLSGPVHGSQQFVKASAFGELATAVAVVRAKLG